MQQTCVLAGRQGGGESGEWEGGGSGVTGGEGVAKKASRVEVLKPELSVGHNVKPGLGVGHYDVP